MGICSSCLGLNRRSSEDSQEEQDPLLYSSSNRAYGGTDADAHNSSHDNNNNPRQDAERLRQEATALERICANTSDKMIDVSEGFGVSKIDSDFRRLFSEAFSPGLLEGPPIQTQSEDEAELDPLESSSPSSQRVMVAASPDIVNAKNESEWFHAIMKAAKTQSDSAEDDNAKTWDGDTVVEIDRPLVFTLEDQAARRQEQE